MTEIFASAQNFPYFCTDKTTKKQIINNQKSNIMKSNYFTNTASAKVIYKDQYYVNYACDGHDVDVNLLTGEIKIDDKLFAEDKELAKHCYRFATLQNGYQSIPVGTFQKFLEKIGAISYLSTSEVASIRNRQREIKRMIFG